MHSISEAVENRLKTHERKRMAPNILNLSTSEIDSQKDALQWNT